MLLGDRKQRTYLWDGEELLEHRANPEVLFNAWSVEANMVGRPTSQS